MSIQLTQRVKELERNYAALEARFQLLEMAAHKAARTEVFIARDPLPNPIEMNMTRSKITLPRRGSA
jgi:hypothetical protein